MTSLLILIGIGVAALLVHRNRRSADASRVGRFAALVAHRFKERVVAFWRRLPRPIRGALAPFAGMGLVAWWLAGHAVGFVMFVRSVVSQLWEQAGEASERAESARRVKGSGR